MKQLARNLRRHQTDAERLLWHHLRGRQLEGCKFRRQEIIGQYIVDFVCLKKMLIVELDGGQHVHQVSRDTARSEELNRMGYRVLRFWNHDALNKTNAVLERIRGALSEVPSPQPSPAGGGGPAE